MSDLVDRGNWLFGAILVTITAIFFALTVTNQIYYSYEAVPSKPPQLTLPRTQTVRYQLRQQPQAEPDDADDNEERATPYRPQTVKRFPLPLVGQQGWWLVSFRPISFIAIAFSLAVLYVPGLILLLMFIERGGSFAVLLRRDYGALLSCTLMAWAVSHLPFALIGAMLNSLNISAEISLILWLLSNLYFGGLMIFALMTVCGADFKNAILIVGIAWIALRFDSWMFSLATFSPFLTIIWLLPLALGALAGMRAAQIQRQSFRRYLDACTLNEHDAEAHYQLGLLYQQRRQSEKALSYFKRAVEIDPKEPDANFQLGVIARLEGRLQEAINHFSIVVAQDDKYRQSEIWREIGATYLAAGMFSEAKDALGKYHERRPFDPEGLFHYGETLNKLGETAKAQEMYRQCIDAVRTMPYYRRNQVSKWSKLSQTRL